MAVIINSANVGIEALPPLSPPTSENNSDNIVLLEIRERLDRLIHIQEKVISQGILPPPPPPPSSGGGGGPVERDVEIGVLVTSACKTLKEQLPFRNYEIGKLILVVVSPITAYLLGLNNSTSSTDLFGSIPIFALLFGVTFIWNGYVLAHPYSEYARLLEELGVILVIMSFFCFLASRSSPVLTYVIVVCFLLCIKPLVLLRWAERFLPPAATGDE